MTLRELVEAAAGLDWDKPLVVSLLTPKHTQEACWEQDWEESCCLHSGALIPAHMMNGGPDGYAWLLDTEVMDVRGSDTDSKVVINVQEVSDDM